MEAELADRAQKEDRISRRKERIAGARKKFRAFGGFEKGGKVKK